MSPWLGGGARVWGPVLAHSFGLILGQRVSQPEMAPPRAGCLCSGGSHLQTSKPFDSLKYFPALTFLLCFLLAPPIWGHSLLPSC